VDPRKKLKILMVVSLFPPYSGGTERQAHMLARGLSQKGHNICVLTRRHRSLPGYEEMDGIKVYRQIRTVDMRYFFGLSYVLSTLFFLCRFRKRYELIHCHQAHGLHTLVALMVKNVLHKKVIVKVASSGATSDFIRLKRSLLSHLHLRYLKHADRIISVCRESSEEILRSGFSKKTLAEIPNAVDIALFAPVVRASRDAPRLTFVGRLSPEKGVDTLLAATKLLVTRGFDVRLHIAGRGPEEKRLKNQTFRENLGPSVVFQGETDNVGELLARTDIFVLPSFSEGLSGALLEAMASGLPVVATAVGGTKDVVVDHQNGLLVPPGSADTMAKAIAELLDNEDLAARLGQRARETVEQGFSLELMIARYIETYGDTVREG
jgi:glycosyltransferase involved in cell wall biosynthesis